MIPGSVIYDAPGAEASTEDLLEALDDLRRLLDDPVLKVRAAHDMDAIRTELRLRGVKPPE